VLRVLSVGELELIQFSSAAEGANGIVALYSKFSAESRQSAAKFEIVFDEESSLSSCLPTVLSRFEILESSWNDVADVQRWDSAVTSSPHACAANENSSLSPAETWTRLKNWFEMPCTYDVEALFVTSTNPVSTSDALLSVFREPLDEAAVASAVGHCHTLASPAATSSVREGDSPQQRPPRRSVLASAAEFDDLTLSLDAMLCMNRVENCLNDNEALISSMLTGPKLSAHPPFSPNTPLTPGGSVDESKLHCKVCNQKFKRVHDARRHERETHGLARLRRCPDCPREFNRESNLRRHRFAVHERKRKFACTHCGTCFSTRGNLERHIHRIHASAAQKQDENQQLQ